MLSEKGKDKIGWHIMATDRQRICKCGTDIADILNDIHILEGNIIRVNMEEIPSYTDAFKLSTNSIYKGIRKVEESCAIDARDQQNTSSTIDSKIGELQTAKDRIKFSEKKIGIFNDLSQIRYQITEKVRKCSK